MARKLISKTHKDLAAINKFEASLAVKLADGSLTTYMPLTPIAEGSISNEIERARLLQSERDARSLVEERVVESTYTLSITLNGFSPHVLAAWSMGEWEEEAVSASPVIGEVSGYAQPNSAVFLGLGSASGIPARNVSAVSVGVAGVLARADESPYEVGDLVEPETPDGQVYVCTASGESGASEPVWPSNGGTVTDGTVTWRHLGPKSFSDQNYEVVADEGVLLIPNTGAIATAITRIPASLRNKGRTFKLALGYSQPARTQRFLKLNAGVQYKGSLYLSSGSLGARNDLHIPECSITPAGDFAIAESDYSTIQLQITFADSDRAMRWFEKA